MSELFYNSSPYSWHEGILNVGPLWVSIWLGVMKFSWDTLDRSKACACRLNSMEWECLFGKYNVCIKSVEAVGCMCMYLDVVAELAHIFSVLHVSLIQSFSSSFLVQHTLLTHCLWCQCVYHVEERTQYVWSCYCPQDTVDDRYRIFETGTNICVCEVKRCVTLGIFLFSMLTKIHWTVTFYRIPFFASSPNCDGVSQW